MKKVIVVGAGQLGSQMAAMLHANSALKAICDVDGRKEALASTLECGFYTSFETLLLGEKETALLLATPTGYHAEQAIKALQAGFDVLSASPLCLTNAAVWQMIETAKFTRRKLLVLHSENILPSELPANDPDDFFLQVAPENKRKSWQQEPFPGGSIFHNEAYDAIRYLVKNLGAVQQVSRSGETYGIEMERGRGTLAIADNGAAIPTLLQMKGGPGRPQQTGASTDGYQRLLQPFTVQEAIEVATIFAAIEKLEKHVNPPG